MTAPFEIERLSTEDFAISIHEKIEQISSRSSKGAMDSSILSRLIQDSRLPDSYASFRVLVRLEREMALSRREAALSSVNIPSPMNLPTSPSAPGPLDAVHTGASALRRTASTPPALLARSPMTPDSLRQPFKPWGAQESPGSRLALRRAASTPTAPPARPPTTPGSSRQPLDPWGSHESPARGEKTESTEPADATRSKTQASHAMAWQLFQHLRAGQWEEAGHMLMLAGHPPLLVACAAGFRSEGTQLCGWDLSNLLLPTPPPPTLGMQPQEGWPG